MGPNANSRFYISANFEYKQYIYLGGRSSSDFCSIRAQKVDVFIKIIKRLIKNKNHLWVLIRNVEIGLVLPKREQFKLSSV